MNELQLKAGNEIVWKLSSFRSINFKMAAGWNKNYTLCTLFIGRYIMERYCLSKSWIINITPTPRRKHYAVYIEIVSSQNSRQKELVKENGELTDVTEQPAPWGCDDGSEDDFDMHE